MSKYKKIAVEFKNMDSLKKALADLGLTWQENVVLENRFSGLGGDYSNSGVHDIVITKDTLDDRYGGWFNHIGFKKDEQKMHIRTIFKISFKFKI